MPGWTVQPSGHPDPVIACIMAVLERWADALEEGSAYHWHPDPKYVWRTPGKTDEERVKGVLDAIRERFMLELPRVPMLDGDLAHDWPDYDGMGYEHQLAMVQEIDDSLRAFDGQPEPEITKDDIAWG